MVDLQRLVVGQAKVRIDIVRVELDRLRQLEDVLVKERHLYVGVGVVEVDRSLQCPARHRDTDARGKVVRDITLEIVKEDKELTVGWWENESCGIKINHGSAGRGQSVHGILK